MVIKYKQEFKQFVIDVFPGVDEDDKVFFKVKGTGQQMVYVIVRTTGKFNVYLVAHERYRHYQLFKSQDCFNENIIEGKGFLSESAAREYVYKRKTEFENGKFDDDEHPYRIRVVPSNWRQDIETYLERGEHLQRDLHAGTYTVPHVYHEGIYLGAQGDYKVAHINTDESDENADFNKGGAVACKQGINKFIWENQPLRIVVHCIERRTISEICQIAEKHVRNKYAQNEYSLRNKNCQHFAWLCAAKANNMTNDDPLTTAMQVGGGALLVGAAAVAIGYGLFKALGSTESDQDRRERERRERNSSNYRW